MARKEKSAQPPEARVTVDRQVDDELLAACGEGRLTPGEDAAIRAGLSGEQRAALRDRFLGVSGTEQSAWRKTMVVTINGVRFVPERDLPDERTLAALDMRFNSDAGDNLTLREYFCELLKVLWCEAEGFSGKRPFGNGGWQYDVYAALVGDGFIPGKLVDGDLEDFDPHIANAVVLCLIRAMKSTHTPSPT